MPAQSTPAPRFPPGQLHDRAGDAVFARGEAIAATRDVTLLSADAGSVLASVRGSDVYRVRLHGGHGAPILGDCTCPAFGTYGFCKHLVAVGLAANAAGDSVADRVEAIHAHLVSLGAEALAAMLLELADGDTSLFRRLDRAAGDASASPAERAAGLRDSLDEALGGLGDFEEDDPAELADIVEGVGKLLATGAAAEALPLIEHVLDDLPDIIERLHEPGDMMRVLDRALELHVQALTTLRPDPRELAETLFERCREGVFGRFADADERYAEALGEAGLAAYRDLTERAFRKLPPIGHDRGDRRAEERHLLIGILDRFAERDGDLDARIALRRSALARPHDHLSFAEFCLAHGRAELALAAAEEAAWLFEDEPDRHLILFLAERLEASGRRQDALAALWSALEKVPDADYIEALWRLGGAAVTDRVLDTLRASRAGKAHRSATDHVTGMEVGILMNAGRLAEAWKAARAHNADDGVLLRLAEASAASLPAEAAHAYRAVIERQVMLVNRHGYEEACRLLARLRPLESPAQHAGFVAALRERHRAKRNFISLLDAYAGVPRNAASGA